MFVNAPVQPCVPFKMPFLHSKSGSSHEFVYSGG